MLPKFGEGVAGDLGKLSWGVPLGDSKTF